MIPWLEPQSSPHFPPTSTALDEPRGLLAAGGSLDVEWLLVAYRQGIFPWFSENEPILWWSPAPRTVLYPQHFHISRSLHKLARQQRYRVTVDENFEAVIQACAGERDDHPETWINSQMISAYSTMHRAGLAHSLECWSQEDELVGGIYGIVLGRIFFGESMFSVEANTSKLCLKQLAESGDYSMIDCQMPTSHLNTLGAIDINRDEFDAALNRWA
jgi:leucyl/phenylalanyl-tRNA--protein transferase